MTPTHTTGQWTMEQGITHIKIWGEREKTGAVLVAEVRNEHGSHSTFGQEEKANARLIAAAPELLGLLKHLIHEADHPDNQTDKELVEQIDWEGIRTAIAKAEGKG